MTIHLNSNWNGLLLTLLQTSWLSTCGALNHISCFCSCVLNVENNASWLKWSWQWLFVFFSDLDVFSYTFNVWNLNIWWDFNHDKRFYSSFRLLVAWFLNFAVNFFIACLAFMTKNRGKNTRFLQQCAKTR